MGEEDWNKEWLDRGEWKRKEGVRHRDSRDRREAKTEGGAPREKYTQEESRRWVCHKVERGSR